MAGPKRFYKTVDVAREGGGYAVHLDGKAVKTPGRAALVLPTEALARAVAEEWRAQGDTVEPQRMPLTRMAFAALDVASAHRERLRDEVLAYGRTDLLCYRAETPEALKARQAAAWDPLLEWARRRHGAPLATAYGIGYVEQPAESLDAFAAVIAGCDDFALVALHGAASLTGSLVLALALADARLDAATAFSLSRLDETFQSEAWGKDAEAEARAARLAAELAAAARVLSLTRP